MGLVLILKIIIKAGITNDAEIFIYHETMEIELDLKRDKEEEIEEENNDQENQIENEVKNEVLGFCKEAHDHGHE